MNIQTELEILSRLFTWNYFKKAKPFKTTFRDKLAIVDSNLAIVDRLLNHSK